MSARAVTGEAAGGAWIAVDGGQSTTRIRTSWRDDVVTGPGFTHDPDRAAAVVRTILAALPPLEGREIAVIATGHTGMPKDGEDRRRIAEALFAATDARVVRLTPDWVTAHIGALGGGPGVVLAAGTGAVALGVGADGAARRVDGAGYLFGDAGSGYWIGRRGLEAGLRTIEGRDDAPALLRAARAHFGDDLALAAWDLYADPHFADTVSRFAPHVIELANASDPSSRAIVDDAARELATSVAAASAVLPSGRVPVAVAGRLVSTGTALERRFAAELALALPSAALHAPAGDALEGAVRLAKTGPGIHAALVHTYQEHS